MIGGFALVAHPARWGGSGIMTFIVNHDGVVIGYPAPFSLAQRLEWC